MEVIHKTLSKLKYTFKIVGQKMTYAILLMFFAYKRKETPKWAKRTIIGAFVYFLSPIDAIPDLAPIIGFTDDFTVISIGLSTIAYHINDEVKEKAKNKVADLFGSINEDDLNDVDQSF